MSTAPPPKPEKPAKPSSAAATAVSSIATSAGSGSPSPPDVASLPPPVKGGGVKSVAAIVATDSEDESLRKYKVNISIHIPRYLYYLFSFLLPSLSCKTVI